MPAFVQVAVNVPGVSGVFDYHLPADLAGRVLPGCLVEVSFNRRAVQGIVLRARDESDVAETLPVQALLDPLPVLTPHQMRLAEWIAATYFAPPAACLTVMLPPGLSQMADTLYSLAASPPPPGLSDIQQRIITEITRRGDLRGRQLDAAFPHGRWKEAAAALVRRNVLLSSSVLPPPAVRPRVVRTARLACSPQEAEARLADAKRLSDAVRGRRQAMLDFLAREGNAVEAPWIYAQSGGALSDLHWLADAGCVILSEEEVWRDPLAELDFTPQSIPALTGDQQRVWNTLQNALQAAAAGTPQKPHILHGVTGSGKTEIYLQAVAETLRLGRQAIILVPEIALTPQTVRRFMARFPGQVGLVHSRLSAGERYDTWRRARAGLLPVIVGPRSALFTPLPNPGLIVVDECHESSYYQDDFPPPYHAVQAAAQYGKLTGAVVLLGSATPEVGMLYHARRLNWPVLELPARILAHRQAVQAQMDHLHLTPPPLAADGPAAALPLPPVEVVDMREELKTGNRSILSRALSGELHRVLEAGQQAILFLNRRGTATYVFCRECGYSLRCPRCDLPLTLHSDSPASARLTCHQCGYTRQPPARCPQCHSSAFGRYGTGTERVEQVIHEEFPNAAVLRWDAETTRQKDAHELILSHFSRHQADLLIGTQMLAKGLDLPLVTLVGVILADVGLHLNDYRAGERTFQLLTQVAGRAGRSPLGGRVILQTFEPENYVIQAAAQHDYAGFATAELEKRRAIQYPPFARLVRLEFRGESSEQAQAEAQRAAGLLEHWRSEGQFHATRLVGPAPCFYARRDGQYRWQIVLAGPDPSALLRGHALPPAWRVQVDPPDML